jgi:hypothetical protein
MGITELLAGLVAVGVLLIVLLWSIFFVKAAIFEKELVIAPFYVTGREDPDGRLARSLALMLQGRMRQLQREFEASQRELVSSEAPADEVDLGTRALLGPLLFHQPITISAMVTDDPPSIDVKVAGIEFGGIAAWLDRVAARKRTLTFAVHFGDDETLVTANLDALPDIATRDLWLRTTAAPGEVVTALAYAVLQGRMAGAKGTAIGALEPEEFRSLLTNLSTIADLNRRIAWGRAQSTEDFRKVFNDLSPLLDKVPEWHELIYLVAQVAERTGDPQPGGHPLQATPSA